jgi:hypothetical protein
VCVCVFVRVRLYGSIKDRDRMTKVQKESRDLEQIFKEERKRENSEGRRE